MALEGNLEDFELTDVFQLIQLGQKDGGLRIESSNDVGVVYFKRGMVIHSKTNFLQGEPAIATILSWKKGRFVFTPGEETLEKTVNLPIQQVILEAARRIDELERIQKLIPSFNVTVQLIEVPDIEVEKIHLKPREWKVLSFVDAALTVRQIALKSGLPELETARIFYGLISSGLVKVVPAIDKGKKEEKKVEKKGDEEKEGGLFGFFRKK
jgi:hypothetical protein